MISFHKIYILFIKVIDTHTHIIHATKYFVPIVTDSIYRKYHHTWEEASHNVFVFLGLRSHEVART